MPPRARSRFAAAAAYQSLSAAEKARIAEEVDASEEFEERADSTIKRREDTKAEVESFYADIDGEGVLWTRPGPELGRKVFFFSVSQIYPTLYSTGVLKTWLTVKVEGTRPRKATDEVIKYSTLKSWRMSLTRIVGSIILVALDTFTFFAKAKLQAGK
jgi:hypothetical protein